MVTEYAPHEQRVIDEKAQNDERLAKLNVFLASDKFKELPLVEQYSLCKQECLMSELSKVLGLRISRFDLKNSNETK